MHTRFAVIFYVAMLTQGLAIAEESRPLHERLLTTPTVRDALAELLGYEILITDTQGRLMRLDGTVVEKTTFQRVRDARALVLFDRNARESSRLLKLYGTRDPYDATLLDALPRNP